LALRSEQRRTMFWYVRNWMHGVLAAMTRPARSRMDVSNATKRTSCTLETMEAIPSFFWDVHSPSEYATGKWHVQYVASESDRDPARRLHFTAREIVERFEPACTRFDGRRTGGMLVGSPCRSLSDAARSAVVPEVDVRTSFRMMIDSNDARLKIAWTRKRFYRIESGICLIGVVTGSRRRCEGLDFRLITVHVTDPYLRSYRSPRAVPAKSSHDLLMWSERELRKKMRMETAVNSNL